MFDYISGNEPSSVFPSCMNNKRICLRLTGGIGDAIIAIGSIAYVLREECCEIIAGVMPHQQQLIGQMIGVTDSISVRKLHEPRVRMDFDAIVSLDNTFHIGREIKDKPYYDLVEEKIGFPVQPGKFRFSSEPNGELIALHPGASNPNRRWLVHNWKELAFQLKHAGYDVLWLGTKDEFGFNSDRIRKLSDITESLYNQSLILATCGYFIGNDSGFAHIAGCLGIPGTILFSATKPEHVIDRYPYLLNVAGTDKPTRSLDPYDKQSRIAIDSITVQMVLDTLLLERQKKIDRAESIANKTSILLDGDPIPSELFEYLKTYYVIVEDTDSADITLFFDGGWQLKQGDRIARVNTTECSALTRAIREFLMASDLP